MKKLFSTLLTALLLVSSLCPQYAAAMDDGTSVRDGKQEEEPTGSGAGVITHSRISDTDLINANARTQAQLTTLLGVIDHCLNQLPQQEAQDTLTIFEQLIQKTLNLKELTQTFISTSQYNEACNTLKEFVDITTTILELLQAAANNRGITEIPEDLQRRIDSANTRINNNTPEFSAQEIKSLTQQNQRALSALGRSVVQIGLTWRGRAYRRTKSFLARSSAWLLTLAIPAIFIANKVYANYSAPQAPAGQNAGPAQAAPAQTAIVPAPQPLPSAAPSWGSWLCAAATGPVGQAAGLAFFGCCVDLARYAMVEAWMTPMKASIKNYLKRQQEGVRRNITNNIEAIDASLSEQDYRPTITNFKIISQPSLTFKDVIGQEEIIDMITPLRNFFHLEEHKRDRQVRFALFAGKPGTGKTMLAKALCGQVTQELQTKFGDQAQPVTLVEIDLDEILNEDQKQAAGPMNQNETRDSKLIAALKRASGMSPCVVLIDEIDKIPFEDRPDILRDFLCAFDGKDGVFQQPMIIIATANDTEKLAPELKREGRLGAPIMFDYPNVECRREFFRRQQEKFNDNEIRALAKRTYNFSFPSMQEVVENARTQAQQANERVTPDHVSNQINRHLRITDKIPAKLDQKKHIAAHHAGHILASILLDSSQRIDVASICRIMPTTTDDLEIKYGHTRFIPASEQNTQKTYKDLVKNIMIHQAGSIAERLLCGSMNTHDHCRRLDRAHTLECLDTLTDSALDDQLFSAGTIEENHRKIKQYITRLLEIHKNQLEYIQLLLLRERTITGQKIDALKAQTEQHVHDDEEEFMYTVMPEPVTLAPAAATGPSNAMDEEQAETIESAPSTPVGEQHGEIGTTATNNDE